MRSPWVFEDLRRGLPVGATDADFEAAVKREKDRHPETSALYAMADEMLLHLSKKAAGSAAAAGPAATAAAPAAKVAAASSSSPSSTAAPAAAKQQQQQQQQQQVKKKTKQQLKDEARCKLVEDLKASNLRKKNLMRKRRAEAEAKKAATAAAKRQRIGSAAKGAPPPRRRAAAPADGGPCVVLLLGVLGCGKGTQGAMLESQLGWTHLSCGEILRRTRKEESDRGNRLRAAMLSDRNLKESKVGGGEYISYETNLEVLREILAETFVRGKATLTSFSIDGARDREQAEIITECAARAGLRVGVAITLRLTSAEGVQRALSRGRGGDDQETLDRRAKSDSTGLKAAGVLQLMGEKKIAHHVIDASPTAAAVHTSVVAAIVAVLGPRSVAPRAAAAAPPPAAAPAAEGGVHGVGWVLPAPAPALPAASVTPASAAPAAPVALPAVAIVSVPRRWVKQEGEVWVNEASGERVPKHSAAFVPWTVELSRSQGILYWYNKHTNGREFRAGTYGTKPPGF